MANGERTARTPAWVRPAAELVVAALLLLLTGNATRTAGDAKSSADDAAAAAQGQCESNNETRAIVLGSWSTAVTVIRPFLNDQTPLDQIIETQGRLLLPEDCSP